MFDIIWLVVECTPSNCFNFKATGSEYNSGKPPTGSAPAAAAASTGGSESQLYAEVEAQGTKVRDLKAAKAAKNVIEGEVKKLLELKNKFKEVKGMSC